MILKLRQRTLIYVAQKLLADELGNQGFPVVILDDVLIEMKKGLVD